MLERIFSAHGPIVLRNEQYDYEQVILHESVFFLDHFSPRENLTYSQKAISLDEAWAYALQACPQLSSQYLTAAREVEGQEK